MWRLRWLWLTWPRADPSSPRRRPLPLSVPSMIPVAYSRRAHCQPLHPPHASLIDARTPRTSACFGERNGLVSFDTLSFCSAAMEVYVKGRVRIFYGIYPYKIHAITYLHTSLRIHVCACACVYTYK